MEDSRAPAGAHLTLPIALRWVSPRKRAERAFLCCVAALLAAFFLLPCRIAAATPDWSRAETVTVKMIDDQFIPNHLEFRAGIPYRLHFVNQGKDLHEFTAPEFVHRVAIGNPQVLAPDVALQPGEAKDFYFLAPHPGHFPFWCADHDWDGMVGTIAIK